MTQRLIKEEKVDLTKFPQVKDPLEADLTLGDLHANALKLLYILTRHEIIDITKEDYKRFAEIYSLPYFEITEDILADLDKIINGLVVKRSDVVIRLIGDELADRGKNDYYVLKIFEKLSQNAVPLEILLSNHGIEFIEAYENKFIKRTSYVPHKVSLIGLEWLIDEGFIFEKELLRLINQVYKPYLKAISYTLDKDTNTISLYSHAPVSLRLIESLAQKMAVPYRDNSLIELAQTIEKINARFTQFVQNDAIHKLYDERILHYSESTNEATPIEFLTWNRNFGIERPENHKGYQLIYIHGHGTPDIENKTMEEFLAINCELERGCIYNLNNALGMGSYNVGAYSVLTSNETQLGLCQEKETEFSQKERARPNQNIWTALSKFGLCIPSPRAIRPRNPNIIQNLEEEADALVAKRR